MTHDPLCDWQQKQCEENCSAARIGDHCSHMWCQCDLIAQVRADERWTTVESAIFVASQYGCEHGLLNTLNAINGGS